MTKYITFSEIENGAVCYFILQRAFPHYIGRIVTSPKPDSICEVRVPNYNMWVRFDGCLRGAVIPLFENSDNERGFIFADMAQWFFNERITLRPEKYKKYAMPNK